MLVITLQNGIDEWRVVFWLSAVVFISATVLFWIFGSADIQPWNDLNQSKSEAIVEEEMKMTDIKGKELQSEDEENEQL